MRCRVAVIGTIKACAIVIKKITDLFVDTGLNHMENSLPSNDFRSMYNTPEEFRLIDTHQVNIKK